MKKLILSILLLPSFGNILSAQQKVIKYCEVVNKSGYVFKPNFFIVATEVDSLFNPRDGNVKDKLRRVNTLKTLPDVLNYMASIGWEFVPDRLLNSLIFKKTFDESEFKKE